MEKLIELLNERIREKRNELSSTIGEPVDVWIYEYDKLEKCITHDSYWVSDECIISKKQGFIKRLVENNKIDWDNQALQYAKSDLSKFFAEWKDKNWMSDDYAMLLMLLAIQDDPIDFLISILK